MRGDQHGLGRLAYLAVPSAPPDPDAFLSDVLTGWKRRQLAENMNPKSVARRLASVLRMAEFLAKYPWVWLRGDADEYFAHLRGVRNLSHNTVRAYQADVKLFFDCATGDDHDWNENCGRLFGTVFSQVVTEFNRARRRQERDAAPLKRPFSPNELQEFFDLADLEPERILRSRARGIP